MKIFAYILIFTGIFGIIGNTINNQPFGIAGGCIGFVCGAILLLIEEHKDKNNSNGK